jgi:phosphatidylinositol alpha-mannosyltransferase
VRLLFVGHWRDPRKGLPDLLTAYTRLRRRGVDLLLDVIGDGGAVLRAETAGVTYHGAVADEAVLAEHYRDCDVFVSPSTGQESFGIVLLEAMATARPIVCSDIAGYRQVVDEEGARLVPPGDPEALEQAIAELAADRMARRRMGEANHRRAARFEWDELAARVREQYVRALELRFGVDSARLRAAADRSDGGRKPSSEPASVGVSMG